MEEGAARVGAWGEVLPADLKDAVDFIMTKLAMNIGVRHLSRFSPAYRKGFGAYRSETMQQRQGAGGRSFGGQ